MKKNQSLADKIRAKKYDGDLPLYLHLAKGSIVSKYPKSSILMKNKKGRLNKSFIPYFKSISRCI